MLKQPLIHHLIVWVFCAPVGLSGLNIVFDYTHDTSDGGDFFGSNPTAKASLEAAGADISAAITTTLGTITTDPIVGSNGSSTFTLNARYSYSNPVTAAPITLDNTLLGADEFRIYVGMRNLSGSTLGQGGPGGVGFSSSGSGKESEWIQTVANAESLFNSQYQRGGGPTVSSFLNQSSTLGSTTANYDLFFGPTIGNLWFDLDTDNDAIADSAATLSGFWHFDHTTSVAAGKYDFYSVAVHEVLHALGFGTAEAWDDQVSGSTDWLGAEASAELGTGTDVLDSDQSHIKAGTTSIALSDSTTQEALMDPNILAGVRKGLTTLDLAFMEDIGWTAIPEPRTVGLALGLAALAGVFMGRRGRSRRRG